MGKKNNDITLEHSKLPPQALDMEEAVLGAAMLEKNVVPNIRTILKEESFYSGKHQLIWKAIVDLDNATSPIDILTVTNQLKVNGDLETIGGPYFITSLTNRIASAANIEFHAQIIAQKYIQRELIRISSLGVKMGFDDQTDVFDSLDIIRAEIDSIEMDLSGKGTVTFKENLDKSIEEAKKKEANSKLGKVYGIPTGLKDLDKLTNGWQKKDLILIAARPSMGKTALSLFFAKTAAKHLKHVAFFSVEMSSIRLTDRLLISETNVEASKYSNGFASKQEWEVIEETKKRMSPYSINIDDFPANMSYIRSKSRQLRNKNRCDIIVIDYLQLVNSDPSKKNQNREQEVADISKKAKHLAKELDVPVILLCQLSREVEKRGGSKRPQLSDLRESGAIEQDADLVIFVYRPHYYKIADHDGSSLAGMGELIIAKHRNGSLDDIPFKHSPDMTKFYDFNSTGSIDYTQSLIADRDMPF